MRWLHQTNGMGAMEHLRSFPVEDIERDIVMAASVMRARVLVLLGGEPLLHKHLLRIMRFAKSSGVADSLRVLTNGLALHRQPPEFWSEMEDLRVSIYPGKTPPENVQLARTKAAEHGFALSFYDVASDPFRAVHTREMRSEQSAQETWDGCWYRSNTRKLEQGYFYRCCTSPSISKTILGLEPDADGIALEGLSELALAAFLERREPMHSCFRCHGNNGPQIAWSEERDKTRWLEAGVR